MSDSISLPTIFGATRTMRITNIVIGQGNKIADNDTYFGILYGAKVILAGITAVPTAVPSSLALGNTLASGLCAGTLFTSAGSSLVWVANMVRISGTDYYDTNKTLIEGMAVSSRIKISVPITGGGGATAVVYLPWINR